MGFLLKLLGAKKRNEIRHGKLWEITRLWGMDVRRKEKPVPQADPFVRPTGGNVEGARVHNVLGTENNVTNITKNPETL